MSFYFLAAIFISTFHFDIPLTEKTQVHSHTHSSKCGLNTSFCFVVHSFSQRKVLAATSFQLPQATQSKFFKFSLSQTKISIFINSKVARAPPFFS
ncbi:MAG: hypothetical protein D6767_00090 [Candidatus Hydrogenedentota bacterium]|nr:MAG: hypothetical protein D6767_00090 [Candidatus Hydrogenedentota bacterium]